MFIFTHDSIGLGEDGPTHQPIEQLAALARDAEHDRVAAGRRERSRRVVAKSWCSRGTRQSTLVLTRQPMPTFDRTKFAPASGVAKGAYVLIDAEGGKPDVILMGTGSEVHLASRRTKSLQPKASRLASSACRRGICSRSRMLLTRRASCRPA